MNKYIVNMSISVLAEGEDEDDAKDEAVANMDWGNMDFDIEEIPEKDVHLYPYFDEDDEDDEEDSDE